jgi:precorrin-6Y C5,15-methyltransferase (decarboxylating)
VSVSGSVAVLGVDGGPLSERAERLLGDARVVAGGRRHLERLAPAGCSRLVLDGDLQAAVTEIGSTAGPVAVLASGDPGFFGIVRALAERLGPERLAVEPAASSVASAFARVGLPWDDAIVVSAHGRDPSAAINAALAHPKVAVLTAPDATPGLIAAGLADADRMLVVAERLGSGEERIVTGTPSEIAGQRFLEPNVVLALKPGAVVSGAKALIWPPRTPPRWGLPESAFEHRAGMITKAEVRAVVLARLGPGTGDLVWDVGCGSGSVAVECARLGAAVVAVDSDPEAVALASRNAASFGVDVRCVGGEAPGVLAGLPDPSAVFVGGGGASLSGIVAASVAREPRAIMVALATLERVGPVVAQLRAGAFEVEGTVVQASRLAPLGDGHRLAAENPVFLVSGSRSV